MTELGRERGAYGLILSRDVEPALLTPAAPDWTPWRLLAHSSPSNARPDEVDFFVTGEFARLPLIGGGWAEIDRHRGQTDLYLDHEPNHHEMAHPAPATTAATVAWWDGRQALHGTSVSANGRALALLGGREHGKSTTSMALLRRGFDLVADDVLVVSGRQVLAGPRSLDLRAEAAQQLGAGTYVGRIGSRDRWRAIAPDCEPVHELAALVELEWGDTLGVESLSVAQSFAALERHRTMAMLPPLDPAGVLMTLTVPFLRLTRPRRLDMLDPAVDALLESAGLKAPAGRSQLPAAVAPASAE